MQIDITTCFAANQLDHASRLITARANRLGITTGQLLTTQLHEMVADEAGVRWTSGITEEVTAAAEARADAVSLAASAGLQGVK
jgi:hypothetical protein